MELETLLTGSKWQIIKQLTKNKQSPLELAEKLNTTIANISQQLRLLELGNIVKKEKTGAAGIGKPRTLFSLKQEFVYIIIASDKKAEKKLIELTKKGKDLLKKLEGKNEQGDRFVK
jgi:DNA-binding transcriptional regulator GbsR (MarR family)